MAEEIKDDVETLVDIEDIKGPPANETVLEPINEKPISFEALKEQVKEQENEQVKEQVIKEETNTESSKCVKTDKNTVPDETKPRKKNTDMKAKTTCPDCGMSLTVHSLKYTHGRYCKSKKRTENTNTKTQVDSGRKCMLRRSDTLPIGHREDPSQQQVDGSKSIDLNTPPAHEINNNITPTPQQIEMYLNNVRKEKALKKQMHYHKLMSNALP